jgi:hypothetical protein
VIGPPVVFVVNGLIATNLSAADSPPVSCRSAVDRISLVRASTSASNPYLTIGGRPSCCTRRSATS